MDRSRYFPNPAVSVVASTDAAAGVGNSSSRLEEHENKEEEEGGVTVHTQLRHLPHSDWRAIAEQLFHKCWKRTRNATSGSLYVGAIGSQAYLSYRLAKIFSTTDATKAHRLQNEALSYTIQQLQRYETTARTVQQQERDSDISWGSHSPIFTKRDQRVSLLEGPYVACKALCAALHYECGNAVTAQRHAVELIQALEQACGQLDPLECELLYGRAGALQCILFLRDALETRGADELLGSNIAVSIARSILEQGDKMANQNRQLGFPLLWSWHDSYYLGAAHGAVGILQMILSLSPSELASLHDYTEKIRATIDELDAQCFPSGNLDSSIHHLRNRRDRLVHWCHGATGHVILLVKAAEVYQNEAYYIKARRIAKDVIWPRGLLRKGVGLCHGISGNAYAFLALGRRRDTSFLDRARFFASFALSHLNELETVPDRPYSLYEGLGGLCCLAIDLADANEARFPLYEFQ